MPKKIHLAFFILLWPLLSASSFSDGTFTSGPNRIPPSAQTVASTDTITADGCGTVKRVTAAGAVTTNTTDTFTAPAGSNSGCIMVVVNVGSNAITLDNNANFVSASATDVVLGANDSVIVVSDGSKWYQASALLDN